MIERRFYQEWPLAAFTLTLQIGCGISMAATVSAFRESSTQSPALAALAASIFPIVASGLLLSLLHLGRPLSAWRALSNIGHSRLSQEAGASALFALSALACSLGWWIGPSPWHVYITSITSLFGLAAVVTSGAIYSNSARSAWNSGRVSLSFLGSTVLMAGLSLGLVGEPSWLVRSTVLIGSCLYLISALWLRSMLQHSPQQPTWFRVGFVGHLLLFAMSALILVAFPVQGLIVRMICVCVLVATAMLVGRMLMFALAEMEPRF